MTDDALIDRFVEVLKARGFESLPQEEVPVELRTGSVEPSEWCDWKIHPADHNPWVAALQESVLPHGFPAPFLSLISRYGFAEFEVAPVMFFANTGGHPLLWLQENMAVRGMHGVPSLLGRRTSILCTVRDRALEDNRWLWRGDDSA